MIWCWPDYCYLLLLVVKLCNIHVKTNETSLLVCDLSHLLGERRKHLDIMANQCWEWNRHIEEWSKHRQQSRKWLCKLQRRNNLAWWTLVFLLVCRPEPSNILASKNQNAVKSNESVKSGSHKTCAKYIEMRATHIQWKGKDRKISKLWNIIAKWRETSEKVKKHMKCAKQLHGI